MTTAATAMIAALEDENRRLRQIAEQLVGELARLYVLKREA